MQRILGCQWAKPLAFLSRLDRHRVRLVLSKQLLWGVLLGLATLYSTLRLLVPDRGNFADWLDALAATQEESLELSETPWLLAPPATETAYATAFPALAPVAHEALEQLATLPIQNWTWPFSTPQARSRAGAPRIFAYPGWLYAQVWGGSASRYLPSYAALATSIAQQYALCYQHRVEHPNEADIMVTVLSDDLPESAQLDGIGVARALYTALFEHPHLSPRCSHCRHVILTEETALVVPSTEALFAADTPDLKLYWLVPPFPNALDPDRANAVLSSERSYTLAILTPLTPTESFRAASWHTEADVRFFSSSDTVSVWALAQRARFCYVSGHPRWRGRIAVAMSAGCIPVYVVHDQVSVALGVTETSLNVAIEHLPTILRRFPIERLERMRAAIQRQFREHLWVADTQTLDDATPVYAQRLTFQFYTAVAS
ncbi:hypothetical protein F1559_004787 [Cyanidiococcus yangmingshanensis]|uniref:Uncharacterized protein n=1 Tax=Cyanidiococcus yangmingshanensis TaxID=2690220 RepID=A0A7J7IMF8_9RHOD|nr:hypothetical protein F1559_004787 [Cyanidiococcus yangmingshanensis]